LIYQFLYNQTYAKDHPLSSGGVKKELVFNKHLLYNE